jgi:sugar lactone lactonase YvrE
VLQSGSFSNAPSLALDSVDDMYTVDQPTAAVLEFAAGSSGTSVPPVRTITSTALVAPYGVALGPAGNIFVSDPMGGPISNGAVDVFASSQSGNVAPVRQITGTGSGLSQPYGITVDGSGNIWVTNDASASSEPASVVEYSSSSNTPIRTISGTATQLNGPVAIALDTSGNIYVANASGNSVTVYAAGSTGNQAPIRVITGSSTGIVLPQGLAFDVSGNLYVSNLQATSVPGTLNIFSPGASGNATPIAELAGSSSVTFNPVGVAI